MRRPPLYATAAVLIIGFVAACSEQVLEPDGSTPTGVAEVDSAAMLAAAPFRPSGLALAPVATDSMVLSMDTDSFTVQLTSRECAAPNNWVVLTSPALDTLSSTMCQETIDTVWSFTDGPYSAGTPVILDFESGVSGYDGKVQFSDTLPAAFPQWNLQFEDAGDDDFDDFLLRVQAYPDSAFALTIQLSDSSDLHPWIRQYGPQLAHTGDTFFQPEIKGDSVEFTVRAFLAGIPVDSQEVTITAEFLPRTGGHHHLDERLSFTDAPNFVGPWADAAGRPVTGSFEHDATVVDSLQVTTDTVGAATLAFRAGFVGGDIDIIAATVYDSVPFLDTAKVRVRVAGLSTIESDAQLMANSYLVGQSPFPPVSPSDTTHARDSIWQATAELLPALRRLALELVVDSVVVDTTLYSGPYHLQINDLSLPFGGAYTVNPVTTPMGREIEDVSRGHRTHTHGIDVDINNCQVLVTGEDGQSSRIAGTVCTAPDRVELDRNRLIDAAKDYGFLVLVEGQPAHYHLRYLGGS